MTPLDQRIALLKAAVKKLAERKDELAPLISNEMGKILSEAADEVKDACGRDDDGYLDLVAVAFRLFYLPLC